MVSTTTLLRLRKAIQQWSIDPKEESRRAVSNPCSATSQIISSFKLISYRLLSQSDALNFRLKIMSMVLEFLTNLNHFSSIFAHNNSVNLSGELLFIPVFLGLATT